MLIGVTDAQPGDFVVTENRRNGAGIKTVHLLEDGSVKFTYEDDSFEWFESYITIMRKDDARRRH